MENQKKVQEATPVLKTENDKAVLQETVNEQTAVVKTIKFVASPTGLFDLAYSSGDVAEFEQKQAKELVEAGYANYYELEE